MINEQEIGTVLAIISRVDGIEALERIRAAVISRNESLNRINISKIHLGMKVSWAGKRGMCIGTVQKVKTKWVLVKELQSGALWNVTASLLKETP